MTPILILTHFSGKLHTFAYEWFVVNVWKKVCLQSFKLLLSTYFTNISQNVLVSGLLIYHFEWEYWSEKR